MPQVNVSINGRDYLLNCGEGEEERLSQITTYLNGKITNLDRITKQSGDTNLMLTVALLASNDVLDMRREIEALRQDINAAKTAERNAETRASESEASTTEAFAKLAARIEQLAASIIEKEENTSPAFRASG